MNKQEYLKELESRLQGLPKEDIANRIEFYSEMIDDRMEDGKSEVEAINEVGTVDYVVETIAKETPLMKLVKEKVTPKRRMSGFEIVLLILGFPLWFPLLMVGFILILVFYLLTWILVIVTYAVEAALLVGSVGAIVLFFINGFNMGYLGAGLLGLGIAFLFIFACVGATKASVALTKSIALSIKKKFVRGK